MIRLPERSLPDAVAVQLAAWQADVDRLPAYAGRVEAAKDAFSARNKRGNATFDAVKVVLDGKCSGARRCVYCEDSFADEVEHFRPKDWYPEAVFAWANYLYACGPCNGPKNNQFAVFVGDDVVPRELRRRRGEPVEPPPDGPHVCIDPRSEEPTALLHLDLGNFEFVPLARAGTREHVRADHTIDLLRLNHREYLPRARAEAFGHCRARLTEFVERKEAGVSADRLERLADAVRRMAHPTVWHEMKRQSESVPELAALFACAPEALAW